MFLFYYFLLYKRYCDTMRLLFFVILVGYAVKCEDDASYYVIEVPEEPRREQKPFRVYWNVPTMQCQSKRIPFHDLHEKFGIIQNNNDSFRGEEIAILYDPGLFPALLKYESSGKFKFRNGGVPQEGSLEKHWDAFRIIMEQSIPDKQFSGIGIIDFESWRPVFRQNFGVLIPYKDISYQIERKQHWLWPEKAIQAKARQRFEESARAFMQTTLAMAKQMRPNALWGYYAYPYCFNMAPANPNDSCASGIPKENDNINWLWHESTALFPSAYLSKTLSSRQVSQLVRGRIREAQRLRQNSAPILPYFWFRYRDGGFLPQEALDVALDTLYKSDASGFIIWGSSKDVNTVDKCQKLLEYTEEILGPAIARYTKRKGLLDSINVRPTNSPPNTGITTWRPTLKDHLKEETNNSERPILDPDYHWTPPENYTQDIVHYVENNYKDKNKSMDKDHSKPTFIHIKKNTLVDLLLNLFLSDNNNMDGTESDEIAYKVKYDETTQNNSLETTTSTNNFTHPRRSSYFSDNNSFDSTKNSLDVLVKDENTEIPFKSEEFKTTTGYFFYIENNIFTTSHSNETTANTTNTNTAFTGYPFKSHTSYTKTTESTTNNGYNNFVSEKVTETTEPSFFINSTDPSTLIDIISQTTSNTKQYLMSFQEIYESFEKKKSQINTIDSSSTTDLYYASTNTPTSIQNNLVNRSYQEIYESFENYSSSELRSFDIGKTVTVNFTKESQTNTIDSSSTTDLYYASTNTPTSIPNNLVNRSHQEIYESFENSSSSELRSSDIGKTVTVDFTKESQTNRIDSSSTTDLYYASTNTPTSIPNNLVNALSSNIELGLSTETPFMSDEFIDTILDPVSKTVTSSVTVADDTENEKLSSETVTLNTLFESATKFFVKYKNKLDIVHKNSGENYDDSKPIDSPTLLLVDVNDRSKDGKKGFHVGSNVLLSPNVNKGTIGGEIYFDGSEEVRDNFNEKHEDDKSTSFGKATANSVR